MTTFFGILAVIAFFGAVIVCPVAWCCGVYYMFRTVNSTVLGREVWKRPPGFTGWFYNPWNRILDDTQLTREGLRYRRCLLLSVAWFVLPILAAVVLAGLGGISKHCNELGGATDSSARHGTPALAPSRVLTNNQAGAFGPPTLIEFPFIGKVSAKSRNEAVRWTSPNGAVLAFQFKFYYADSGVWIRAEYLGPGKQYDETPVQIVQELYQGAGETIIGFPAKPPRLSVQEFLTGVRNRIAFEKASRIVLEYVLLRIAPQDTEPYLIIKIWGAETAWSDKPDIPRVRILLGLNSGSGWLDDAL